MTTTQVEAPGGATVTQRWLARLALVAAAAAVLVAPVVAGLRQSLALVLVGLAGLAVGLAGAWWALTNRGLVRGLAAALAVAAPLTVLVLYTRARLTWVVLVALGLGALAVAAGRAALRRDVIPERMGEHEVPPPRRPFLIMNPRSGGGKVTRFGLKDKAEGLGATVVLLEGPGTMDVGELARQAVVDGADLLGWPAGMGPRHWSPASRPSMTFRCWSSRLEPATTSRSISDWIGRTRRGAWMRCATAWSCGSIWASSATVRSSTTPPSAPTLPWCRARPTATTRPAPPWTSCQDCWSATRGHAWWPRQERWLSRGRRRCWSPTTCTGWATSPGWGRRARLDRGALGVFAVTVTSAVQAAGLLRGTQSRGLTRLAGREVTVDADASQIPVGVDGEALLLDTPVRCTLRPATLRVRVPRDRPGVPDPKPIMDWKRLRQMALTHRQVTT